MKKRLFVNKGGQTVVELAIVLPILLLIVFGIIDLSRLAYHQSLMNQTAKEALRMASVGNELEMITKRIEDAIKPLVGNSQSSISVGTDDEGNACTQIIITSNANEEVRVHLTPLYNQDLKLGDTVRISITYTMEYITPLVRIFGNSQELKAVYFTRMENPP